MKPKLNHLKIIFLTIIFASLTVVCGEEEVAVAAPEAVEQQDELREVAVSELVGRVLIYLGLLGAIGYSILMFTRKGRLFTPRGKVSGTLSVTDTHMLGNKQFLVVVEYESKRILLGVGPGMIQKLSDLPAKREEPSRPS